MVRRETRFDRRAVLGSITASLLAVGLAGCSGPGGEDDEEDGGGGEEEEDALAPDD
jgi:hypothetical protein